MYSSSCEFVSSKGYDVPYYGGTIGSKIVGEEEVHYKVRQTSTIVAPISLSFILPIIYFACMNISMGYVRRLINQDCCVEMPDLRMSVNE